MIGQKAEIGMNPFTPRGHANLYEFLIRKRYDLTWPEFADLGALSSMNWMHPKWRANSWPRAQYQISIKRLFFKNIFFGINQIYWN